MIPLCREESEVEVENFRWINKKGYLSGSPFRLMDVVEPMLDDDASSRERLLLFPSEQRWTVPELR